MRVSTQYLINNLTQFFKALARLPEYFTILIEKYILNESHKLVIKSQ